MAGRNDKLEIFVWKLNHSRLLTPERSDGGQGKFIEN